MSGTGSYTTTFTAADIVKVADRFGADLTMLAQATGAMSKERAADVISDVKELAKKDYIKKISVVLFDSAGKEAKARRYVVSKDASLWTSDRPGDNLWPREPYGDLSVILHYTAAWQALGESGQEAVHKTLRRPWGPSDVDTSFPGLTGSASRRYASNAYGFERTDFE